MKYLLNKRVLVTGGAVRIGRAFSEAFANAGASVRIHYNNSAAEAAELSQSLSSSAEIIKCDFRNPSEESLRSLVKECDAREEAYVKAVFAVVCEFHFLHRQDLHSSASIARYGILSMLNA